MSYTLTEKHLIRLIKDSYTQRLHEVLGETDLLDKQGKIVIQKGLKVRHKESQYEYTVDSVSQDAEGSVSVKLRNPDVARINPSDSTSVMSEDDLIQPGTIAQQGDDSPDKLPVDPGAQPEELSADDVFIVDQTEFEKEYEVK